MKNILLFTLLLLSMSLHAVENQLLYDPLPGEEDIYLDIIYDNMGTENSYDAFIALQRLTAKQYSKKDYKAMKELYIEFKKDLPEYADKIDKIIAILSDKDYKLEEINLGSHVNTEFAEYSPTPNGSGNRLYFTGYGRSNDNRTEDIFMSEFKDGFWQPAEKLQDGINSDNNMEAPQCITTDDNTLIFFGNLDSSLGRGDLFYSQRISNKLFGEVQHFPRPINSEYFDCDAKINNNGTSIVFISDRPGGIGEQHNYGEYWKGSMQGNTDIYVAVKDDDGNWKEPINLGKVINTEFAERKPFLHPDGMTLYFSSNGHAGLGRMDLYMAKRLYEDSWTDWSEPVNMSKEINSPGNERAAIINTFGELAYFATAERPITFGQSDIFTMSLPDHLRPNPVAVIKGTVKDTDGNPIDAKILWENLENGRKMGEMRSNPETGEYFIIFPLGKNYGFYAEKEGYFPISKSIDLTKKDSSMTVVQDIILYPVSDLLTVDANTSNVSNNESNANNSDFDKSSKKLRINNLFFAYRESSILSSSYPELERVAYLLNNYPKIAQVEIAGYSDDIGGDDYNKNLSLKRAESVRDYLIKQGVRSDRLVANGYGEESPVGDNTTEEGRALNRRVEMKILEVK
ncbi:MAG: OmpA family protein [Candidatus Kapaibacterium sp.]